MPPGASVAARRQRRTTHREASLKVFLEMCEEDGAEPRKWYSGRFNLRISPELHASAAAAAAAEGKSLNQWIAGALATILL